MYAEHAAFCRAVERTICAPDEHTDRTTDITAVNAPLPVAHCGTDCSAQCQTIRVPKQPADEPSVATTTVKPHQLPVHAAHRTAILPAVGSTIDAAHAAAQWQAVASAVV